MAVEPHLIIAYNEIQLPIVLCLFFLSWQTCCVRKHIYTDCENGYKKRSVPHMSCDLKIKSLLFSTFFRTSLYIYKYTFTYNTHVYMLFDMLFWAYTMCVVCTQLQKELSNRWKHMKIPLLWCYRSVS